MESTVGLGLLLGLVIAVSFALQVGTRKHWNFFQQWGLATTLVAILPLLIMISICEPPSFGDVQQLCRPLMAIAIIIESLLSAVILGIAKIIQKIKSK